MHANVRDVFFAPPGISISKTIYQYFRYIESSPVLTKTQNTCACNYIIPKLMFTALHCNTVQYSAARQSVYQLVRLCISNITKHCHGIPGTSLHVHGTSDVPCCTHESGHASYSRRQTQQTSYETTDVLMPAPSR